MFESLDEQMKKDEDREASSKERVLRWLLALVVTVLVIGGLYWGVHLLQGT
jgi:flagellar biogenesis protein FliO